MTYVGIDKLCFYTSNFYLDLKELAKARNQEVDKFYIGLGQEQMSIHPPDEDVITLAANAAWLAIQDTDPNDISMILFATESGLDFSKSCGVYIQHLLGLPKTCRILEVKQACYSGAGALMLAMPYLRQNPTKKVLLITSDIARYGLNTPGEPTQGCGSAAMLLSANPKLIAIEPESGYYSDHTWDFWRPNYSKDAIVDGKYSTRVYLTTLQECWKEYQKNSCREYSDHTRFCYHLPFTKMAEKAHERLRKTCGVDQITENLISDSLEYSRRVGNSYTASLFIGIASILDHAQSDISGQRIGFFSYGSGCVAEFFSGIVQKDYKNHLTTLYHKNLLDQRKELSITEYEDFFNHRLPESGVEYATPRYTTGKFRLAGVKDHTRQYEKMF